MGGSILGAILGLGSKREWSSADCFVECDYPARALGRVRTRTRVGRPDRVWQRRDQSVMVWGQYARRWLAFLRLHGSGVRAFAGLCWQPVGHHDDWLRSA